MDCHFSNNDICHEYENLNYSTYEGLLLIHGDIQLDHSFRQANIKNLQNLLRQPKALKTKTRQNVEGVLKIRQFHALSPTKALTNTSVTTKSLWSLDSIRTIIRNHFPKASEYKRIKKHGWKARLSTKHGRRVIMRRILKGRFFLTH